MQNRKTRWYFSKPFLLFRGKNKIEPVMGWLSLLPLARACRDSSRLQRGPSTLGLSLPSSPPSLPAHHSRRGCTLPLCAADSPRTIFELQTPISSGLDATHALCPKVKLQLSPHQPTCSFPSESTFFHPGTPAENLAPPSLRPTPATLNLSSPVAFTSQTPDQSTPQSLLHHPHPLPARPFCKLLPGVPTCSGPLQPTSTLNSMIFAKYQHGLCHPLPCTKHF